MIFKEYYEKSKGLDESDAFKLFVEYKKEHEEFQLFTDYKLEEQTEFPYLTEEENLEVNEYVKIYESKYGDLSKLDNKFLAKVLKVEESELENLDEGLFGKILGGTAGLLFGATIGKIIANALGVEKGILYDMFTSKLVNIALGAAIGKHITEPKNNR